MSTEAAGAPAEPPPHVTYCFGGRVYVALTNESNAGLTMLAANGPNFAFPPGTTFAALEREPTVMETATSVLRACRALNLAEAEGGVENGEGKAREVVFAGLGEPLVRLPELIGVLSLLKGHALVQGTRLNTNGLVPRGEVGFTASVLKEAGLGRVCVQLQTADPDQYSQLMQPDSHLSLDHACAFVRALVSLRVPVDVSAIGRPEVDMLKVKALAEELGAESFYSRPYFP